MGLRSVCTVATAAVASTAVNLVLADAQTSLLSPSVSEINSHVNMRFASFFCATYLSPLPFNSGLNTSQPVPVQPHNLLYSNCLLLQRIVGPGEVSPVDYFTPLVL